MIQIWTAMIAYLLLLWLKLRSWAGWSVLELTRLVQKPDHGTLQPLGFTLSPNLSDHALFTLFRPANINKLTGGGGGAHLTVAEGVGFEPT